MKIPRIICALLAFGCFTAPALADHHMLGNWSLSAAESKVAFGSIKKGTTGEVHDFKTLTGEVLPDGTFSVAIDLASVDTGIDIRNERMLKLVFDAARAQATLTAGIEPHDVASLQPGDTATLSIEGTLTLNGNAIPMATDMFVARLSDTRLIVTTDEMIMLSMESAGIDAGITELMKVAKLPSIARVSPVTLRLVFDKQ